MHDDAIVIGHSESGAVLRFTAKDQRMLPLKNSQRAAPRRFSGTGRRLRRMV